MNVRYCLFQFYKFKFIVEQILKLVLGLPKVPDTPQAKYVSTTASTNNEHLIDSCEKKWTCVK